MKKTYSQKIASIFIIVNSILLFPSTFYGLFSTIYLSVYGIGYLKIGRNEGIIFLAIAFTILFIYSLNIYLFISYIKHSVGTLEKHRIRRMWVFTAILNGILSFFALPGMLSFVSFLISVVLSYNTLNDGGSVILYSLIYTLFYLWWIIATILSITVLRSANTQT